ncbi:MAG: hypothetical protein IPJ23_11145 [Ignavibacteriales bacterium]|nr:hypothetical protein [Ignavibacteriales bacterium]
MKSLSIQMMQNNDQIKTQIKKMTIAIIIIAAVILVSFVMIIANVFN